MVETVTLTQVFLLAIWAGIAGIDMYNGLTHVHRPIFSGMVAGIILGDVQKGLIVGATLELVWMGMVPLGGAQPPNVVVGGIIGTAFAIILNLDNQAAVGFAVPFAVAVQGLITLLFTAFSFLMHKADVMAENCNTRGLANINYYGILILATMYFVVVFLPVYFGADVAKSVVSKLPQWLIGGLSVAGGIMPAIGLAMLLKIMLKKDYIAYFAIGFVLVTYLKLPILAVAILALSLAGIDYFIRKSITLQAVANKSVSNDEEGI